MQIVFKEAGVNTALCRNRQSRKTSSLTKSRDPLRGVNRKMKNYFKTLVLLLIVSVTAVVAVYFSSGQAKNPPSPTQTPRELRATLIIEGKSFDVSSFIGKTALEATKSNAQVEESGTGENSFVVGINGRSADSKKKEFWELVINGAPAQVGAGSYIIQNGDIILWKLSTY